MTEIEKKSYAVFAEISKLVQNKIVNAALGTPIHNALTSEEAMEEYLKRLRKNDYDLKKIAVKNWFPIMLAMCATLHYATNEKANYSGLAATLLICFMIISSYKIFGQAPLEAFGKNFLKEKEAYQLDLEFKQQKVLLQRKRAGLLGYFSFFSDLNELFYESGLNPMEHESIVSALFAVKNGSFDCVAISAIAILKLAECGISNIERVYKIGSNIQDPHSYVVVNRTQGAINNIITWNDDSIIFDPWYGVFITAKALKENPQFFIQYPLLEPTKKVFAKIPSQFYSSQYMTRMLHKFNGLVAQSLMEPKRKKTWSEGLGLDLLFPRISLSNTTNGELSDIQDAHLKKV